MPSYPVLEIDGPIADLEIAISHLLDWGCLGTAEEDGGSLRAFFPEGTEVEPLARDLEKRLPALSCRRAPPEPVRDWLAEWKESFTGFALGERFFVLPTWKTTTAVDRCILRLDPEQAFGTGTHDTTRLSAELLERFVAPGSRVIDLGAGTGILAMVAARMRASSVIAIEPDPDAARCARENLVRNGLTDVVSVVEGGYEDFDELRSDVIVANMHRPALEAAVVRMQATTMVMSGILAGEVEELRAALPARFALRETWTAGEWAALVLQGALR